MRKPLPEALKEEISSRGITQRAAAKEIGTDYDNLSRWLTKDVEPGPEWYEGLQRFLGIDQDTLGAMIIETKIRRYRRGAAT